MVYMKKKNHGKTIVIVLLVLSVIGLTSYIIYGNIYRKSENIDLKEKIEKLNSEINKLDKDNKNFEKKLEEKERAEESKKNNFINGLYYGIKEGTDQFGNQNSIKRCLSLFNDGTFKEFHVDGEGKSGTYTIQSGKIVLSGTNVDGNFTLTYDISDDYNTIVTEDVVLTKM